MPRFISLAPSALALAGCVSVTANDLGPSVVRAPVGDFGEATLRDSAGRTIGSAAFRQGPLGVVIRIEADGLAPGWHGVHLHMVGQCDAPGFQTAGGHVVHRDGAAVHGLLNAQAADAGDLPNIHADGTGHVSADIFTSTARIASIGPGEWLWDEDGSAIVIHAAGDDYQSQPIGGSGGRVACGLIAAG